MSASFPATVKSFTTKTDSVDFVHASHIDDLQDEVTAIEQDLINGLARIRASSSTLAIASDAVTVTKSLHAVDTEAATPSDNLATINAGAGVGAGHLLILYAANVGHVVTVKDGAGNIAMAGGDFALDSAKKSLMLRYDGAVWVGIESRAGGIPSIAGITDGQILIGKTSDHSLNLATVTGGVGFVVTNGPGSITLTPSVTVLDRQVTLVTFTNTTTETSMYSFPVPGGSLGTTRAIRLTAFLKFTNNNGGGQNMNVRVKFGGTTIAGGNMIVGPSSVNTIKLEVVINAENLTNAQRAVSMLFYAPAAAGTWTSLAATSGATSNITLALDSTVPQTLQITGQCDTATLEIFDCHYVVTELVG